MPKICRFEQKKKWYASFFFVISKFFLGRFSSWKRFSQFFFDITFFFFYIKPYIWVFFYQILKDYHDENSQKPWKWPKVQWGVKFFVSFVSSQPSLIVVKWATLKKTNLSVFFDIKGRCYLVSLQKSNSKRIDKITGKSRNDIYLSKNLNFKTSNESY